MKSAFIDKLMDRLDRVDSGSLQNHFLRLAQEKGLMETILQAIQEGILVLAGDGQITYANTACQKLLGLVPEEAVGQHVRKYLREIDWERILRLHEEEWSKLVSREIEITYPDHRFISFYVVPLSMVEEKEEGAVLILRDITRDREAEASTLESERLNALTLLAAGVAHEIGNPLNSLTIHLQLLERDLEHLPESERENLRELVDVCRGEVTRLDQIINQFLKAVRPTRPNFERASVVKVLNDTLKFLRHEIEDRDVLVEVDMPEQVPDTLIDKSQIRQAIYNVTRNAIQAMRDGGLLKIVLSSDDRFVAIAFTDTGPGITTDDMSQIFEPYQTTKSEGSGLGLMIVQRIVRDHGGEIEVDSEPGKGTTFTLFLPRDERRIRLLEARSQATDDEEMTS